MKKIFIITLVVAALATTSCNLGQEDPAEALVTTSTTAPETTTSSTTTSTSTTTTTTLPEATTTTVIVDPTLVLHPNDFVCGMDVERRYRMDEERPAPLGLIWEDHVHIAGSAILMGYGKVPEFPVQNYADFCFGDDETGNPIIFRFWLNARASGVIVGRFSSTGTDLLPFGNSVEANNVAFDTKLETTDQLIGRFVIGRQYVFSLSTNFTCKNADENGNLTEVECEFDNNPIIRYLTDQATSLPEKPGMIVEWYGMPGHI